MKSEELAREIAKVLDEKKAEDIKVIKTEEHTIISEYFIIATGTSNTHTKALANDVEDAMTKLGVEPAHVEGRATGWTLIDYGSVLVHVFEKQSREYYSLERLWTDVSLMDISDLLTD